VGLACWVGPAVAALLGVSSSAPVATELANTRTGNGSWAFKLAGISFAVGAVLLASRRVGGGQESTFAVVFDKADEVLKGLREFARKNSWGATPHHRARVIQQGSPRLLRSRPTRVTRTTVTYAEHEAGERTFAARSRSRKPTASS